MTVKNSVIYSNLARGGNGGFGANGGDGLGGGLMIAHGAPSATVEDSSITGNQALGGAAGPEGGNAGDGLGGGVYNLGVFTPARTVITGNPASTSKDNIYP